LGFDRPTANSLDSVADRDFALEYLAALAMTATHLSRLAEEIVLWMSDGFRFIRLSDAYTTGSSIMPQKKNPDAAELVRAKAGQVIGALTQLLIVMKGLPLTYGKDMQDDKAPTFAATDTILLSLAATAGMVRDLTADQARMRAATEAGFITATDLADWLVRVLDLPFRAAHHATGELVRRAEAKGCGLASLSLAEMQGVEPRITDDVFSVLSVDNSVNSRKSFGGTASDNVRRAAVAARERFL
jgi:argininosuccinate lyase